jgi:hypothetical protein
VTAQRWAFSIAVAAALFGGCAGSQAPFEPVARGQAARIQAPCVYLLGAVEDSDLSHIRIAAPNCYFYINASANMSYSTIKAARILYAGAPPNEMRARFPEATPAPGPVVSDPCPTIRGCEYLTNHPPVTSGCPNGFFDESGQTIGDAGQVTCFNKLTIGGENETVCGLIEITGIQLHLNNSSISSCSSGVTFAMSSKTSDTNFSSANLTLAPPKAGKYRDVLFYRVKSQSANVNFSTCRCNFAGILYFPTTAVDYTSTGSRYQLLIFRQVNFSADSRLRLGNPP